MVLLVFRPKTPNLLSLDPDQRRELGQGQDVGLDGEDHLVPDLLRWAWNPKRQIANPGEEWTHGLRNSVKEPAKSEYPGIRQELGAMFDTPLGRIFCPG
jgi:hypothetical protein